MEWFWLRRQFPNRKVLTRSPQREFSISSFAQLFPLGRVPFSSVSLSALPLLLPFLNMVATTDSSLRVANGVNGPVNGINGTIHGYLGAGASATAQQRPLVLQHQPSAARVSIPVSSDNQSWTVADVARERFVGFLEADPDVRLTLVAGEEIITAEDEDVDQRLARHDAAKAERDLVLLSHFLRFLTASPLPPNHVDLLLAAFTHFINTQLSPSGKDVHSLVSSLDNEKRRIVLRAFYEAREALRMARAPIPPEPVGRLFGPDGGDAGRPKEIYALFGGQGGANEVYFDEFQVRLALAKAGLSARTLL
jgi:N-terminal domain in fatty acid synthase subunit beta